MALVTGVLSRESYTGEAQLGRLETTLKSLVGGILYNDSDVDTTSVTAAVSLGSPAELKIIELGVELDGTDIPGNNPGGRWHRHEDTNILVPAGPEEDGPGFIEDEQIRTEMVKAHQRGIGGLMIAGLVTASQVSQELTDIELFPVNPRIDQVGVLVRLSREAEWIESKLSTP